MRRGLLLLSVLASTLSAATARADDLSASRYDIVERAHVVDVRVDRGFATLVVRRTVRNNGPKSDQATFSLELPWSAVATRLRTEGVDASGRPVWFEGDLMEAEAAAERYRELTGIGGYYPKDPALLSWRDQGHLALQVFPVPARGTKTVEYTLKLPLAYEGGAYRAELPPMRTDALDATVRASAAHPGDAVTINGVSGARLVASAAERVTIELRSRGVPALGGGLASVAFGEGKHLVRSSIVAAPHLAEAPRGAHVVVLFDASRSHHDASPALAAVRAYLGSMPEATVDFLTFDREVRAPIGRALPVATALARLAEAWLTFRNGSQLDQALARADAILQSSAASARRVVVVTDTLTRSALGPEPIGATPWRSGAVLHLATVSEGSPRVARDDGSPWATLPRRTGGLFWDASAESVDAATRVVFEEWARPKRLERLSVSGLGDAFERPSELAEGEEVAHFAVVDAPVERVSIAGELWARPLAATFAPTEEQNRLASALVFGSELWSDLSEPEQMQLAMRGRAVSPVTSYLAIEPGVRPSTEGLDWGMLSGVGSGSGSGFGRAASSRSGGVKLRSGLDAERWLRDELAKIARTCTSGAGEVSAIIESTLDEIVDVRDVAFAPARDAKVEACVREGAWNLGLPDAFEERFEVYTVKAAF